MSKIIKTVFVVQHVAREDQDDECVKFIGTYSTEDKAKEAIQKLVKQPGFCDYPNGFCIDEYQMDQDHWEEGFVTEYHDA